jgi:isopenicillin N synthase-like dioxygenase
LQIKGSDGVWAEVPIIPNSFVINVGDLMARWTNNRWRSTLHRVSNPDRGLTGSTRRLSLVAFTSPHEDWKVECLPTCVGEGRPPLFDPVIAGQYVQAKLSSSMTLSAP